MGYAGMRANRAYRLIVRRGGWMPALLADPARVDHIEVVEIDSGEVVLFWDSIRRRRRAARGRCVPTWHSSRTRSSSRAGPPWSIDEHPGRATRPRASSAPRWATVEH